MKSSPATYGGVGWHTRAESHREDVEAGSVWFQCGSRSEVGTLLEISLAWPTPEMFPGGEPNEFLFLEWPDIKRLQAQAESIAVLYESLGVSVRRVRTNPARLPNFLFQRDLFFMTPEGAVLSRPASPQRAGEARYMARALAELGVPILATPRGHAVFEGADALWLGADTALIGIGDRTNAAGADFVARLLREQSVDAVFIELPKGVQHLLGIVNFVNHKLAAVRQDKATAQLLGVLGDAGIETLSCAPGPDVSERLGMNFVAVGPGRVVMPSGCPSVRDRLRDAGAEVHEAEISEYCKAAGGLGCLTGIIRRQI